MPYAFIGRWISGKTLSLPWKDLNHRKGSYSCCNPPMTGEAVLEGIKLYWPGEQGSLRKGTWGEYLFQTCIGHAKLGGVLMAFPISMDLYSISVKQTADSLRSIYIGVKTLACTDGCTKMQNSCQSKWVLNSNLFHFQLSKFSLILQDTERTYSPVPKHRSSSLQYNRTNSLIRPKCRACWKTRNIQDVVREGENLPCSLGELVLLLQSQCSGAKDYLVGKERVILPCWRDTTWRGMKL